MNTPNSSDLRPIQAKIKKTNIFSSVVWLIPLIALFTGGWLLIKHLSQTGPEITLLMDSAEGIEVNNTVIKVLSVDVGRVTKIKLRDNEQGVEITARMNADVKDLMRKDTQFWVVKPRIDQSGITGLGTLVSGSYIAFNPGKSEESEHVFKVSDIPPISAIGQKGIRLHLTGLNNRMLGVGSPILYENFTVGQVESARFNPDDQTVNYTVFIHSPNDKLVNTNSRFWLDSGISVQTGGSGLQIDSPPLPALLSGAIAFSNHFNEAGRQAHNEDVFQLYNDRSEVENLPTARSLYLVAFFKQSIRGLTPGAPVEYKGINIGSVAAAPYFDRNDSHHLFENGWIPVRLRIEPERMEINATPQSKAVWEAKLHAAMRRGLVASLSSDNLLLGSKMVELSDSDGKNTLKPFANYAGNVVIASESGGIDAIQQQLNLLLNKFNSLPLEDTLKQTNAAISELRQTLQATKQLINRPQTQNLPAELNQTLRQLRQTLAGVSSESLLYRDVQQTLNNIDRTLKDVRPLINTLSEQPNALIFNSNHTDPTPKGVQQ